VNRDRVSLQSACRMSYRGGRNKTGEEFCQINWDN